MISFIEENYESLKRLCKQYRVRLSSGRLTTGYSPGFYPDMSFVPYGSNRLPMQST